MRIMNISPLAFMLLAACAAKPENISPAFISDTKYNNWSCDDLATERARYDDALAQASTQQRKARSNDTLGVIFLGLPVSTLAGNNAAGEIGRLKGEVDALARAQGKQRCAGKKSSIVAASSAPTFANTHPTLNAFEFGIEGSAVTKASVLASVMAKPYGVVISRIVPNSAAENAGLVVGDVIQSFNGIEVATNEDLGLYFSKLTPDSQATLGVWRNQANIEIIVAGSSSA